MTDINESLFALKQRLRKSMAKYGGSIARTIMAASPAVTINKTLPTSPYTTLPSGTITSISQYEPYINILGGWPNMSSSGFYISNTTYTIDAETGGTLSTARSIATTVAFNSDAPVLHFRLGSNPVSRYWIKIDGAYTNSGGYVNADTATHYVHIDWTGVSGEGLPHTYEIELQSSGDASATFSAIPVFGPLYIRPLDRVWPLSDEEIGPQIGVFSDSLGAGVTYGQDTPVNQHASYAKVLGRVLGCRNVWASAASGVGWIARSSGQNVPDIQNRIGDITDWPHDIIVIALGINDNSLAGTTVAGVTISPTTVQQRVEDVLSAIRLVKPNTPIIVIGPWWRTANVATAQSYEDAISAGVDALSDPRIGFIPTIEPSWLNGNGSAQAPSGGGNADRYITDSDGQSKTHWMTVGHQYIAGRLLPEFLSVLDEMH